MDIVSSAFDGESLITPEAIGPTDFDRVVEGEAVGLADLRSRTASVLDAAVDAFGSTSSPAVVLGRLVRDLHALRSSADPADWATMIPEIQAHRVAAFVHQDPFTAWSFRKPFGYSGDASLLDFIYGHEDAAPHIAAATEFGRALMTCTIGEAAPAAVRERREILGRTVDATAARLGRPIRVLTIASGHLREAALSTAMAEGRVERWIALDQDPRSVAGIASAFAGTPVEPMEGSVRGLLRREYDLGSFDLVYSAGLYDYLVRKTAVALTSRCLDMLAPGGSFLFANFAAVPGGLLNAAYMETYMKWLLIYRDGAEMDAVMRDAVGDRNFACEGFSGENGNILYGVVTRPGA